MRLFFVAAVLMFSSLSQAGSAAEPPKGFVALFNGENLSGWKGVVDAGRPHPDWTDEQWAEAQAKADASMRAHWSVSEDGVLLYDGKGDSLSTAADYRDFELFVDWKIEPGGDSGIYLRGVPQVQIWDTKHEPYFTHGAEKGSGSLWNNKVGERFPAAHADKPAGEWNTFHIRMIGPYVTVKLNNQVVVDDVVLENYWDREKPIAASGPIFLQNHGNVLFFKNIFLREIGADEANVFLTSRDRTEEFASAFNGNDLTGWEGAVDNYVVADASIMCQKGKGGTLYTDATYGDFVALLQFQLPAGGNNGLAVRYPGTGSAHLDGFTELQVLDNEHPKYANLHPTQYHGSAYGLVPALRGYLREPGEWNYQKVTVKGPTIQVELNGYPILDADLSTVTESKNGPVPDGVNVRSGHFGFAGYNDPVKFRAIYLKSLPTE